MIAAAIKHPWNIGIEEARALQRQLAGLVVESDRLGEIRCVAGVDLSGVRASGKATAAAVLLTFPALQQVEERRVQGPLEFPYVPGYLSFREAPLMLEALRGLQRNPDLILVDGHGRAHPRRIGIASHLGLLADTPTIGCAKSVLVGEYGNLSDEVGATAPLVHRGEVIGLALRTKIGSKPIFVSVGHRVSLSTARDLVMRCVLSGQRIPEPTRRAHNAAAQEIS